MRKKSSMQNNNFNHRNKPRYPQQGGGGHNHGNRPRKNYGASREKYLAQARDALAAGDRVLAENYFQHADHCYRMMVEEGAFRPRQPNLPAQQAEDAPVAAEEAMPDNVNQLPAFLTTSLDGGQGGESSQPAIAQEWEE